MCKTSTICFVIIFHETECLISLHLLNAFILGGGARTGFLWVAQVEFKWELSPYCIFCKFDANKTFRSDSASSVNTIMPAETNGGGGNGGNGAPRASLLCRPNSHPFQVIFSVDVVDEVWSAEKIVKIKSLFRWEIAYSLLRIECSPWTVPWRWDAAWQEPGRSRQTPYLIARFDKYLIARFDKY